MRDLQKLQIKTIKLENIKKHYRINCVKLLDAPK